jgi:hypothetical protein
MVTKDQAVATGYGDEFRRTTGKPIKVRVMGKCKTWKTRPAEFRLPVKYGMYEHGYIDQNNAADWERI